MAPPFPFAHLCMNAARRPIPRDPDTLEVLGLQMCIDRLELASPWTQCCAVSLLALISKQTLLCVLQCHLQQLQLLRRLAGLVQDMVAWKVALSDHGCLWPLRITVCLLIVPSSSRAGGFLPLRDRVCFVKLPMQHNGTAFFFFFLNLLWLQRKVFCTEERIKSNHRELKWDAKFVWTSCE